MEEETLKNNDCVEHVIRYYSDMVYRLAFARSGNAYDADEIFQEVFLRYVKKQPVFREEVHRKAWLIRVTINCAKKLHMSAWRRKTEPLNGLKEGKLFNFMMSCKNYHRNIER